MPHNNEQGIDQWVEENGKTRYQEFDGTERKDDRNEVPDLEDFCDTADKDRYENEMTQYDTALESFDTDLAECSSGEEELATIPLNTTLFRIRLFCIYCKRSRRRCNNLSPPTTKHT